MSGTVQYWLDLKTLLIGKSGLDGDTLRVLASLPLHLLCALLLRRPIASLWPWLLLLLVAGGNEVGSAYVDGGLDRAEIRAGARDVALMVALPTMLLLAAHVRLLFPHPRPARTTIQFAAPAPPRAEPIVDAEFEEIG
ncbi:hypothetical protein E2493_08565 [Sphingomonas parva]|uniref:Uncharacterized protein n=1 Tax=Sphingomonas parva TaxID=2555898 RepID=A0A4Y8ZVB7_9SPHN|nr:hypothetical protein [Sphingomonas parva]TFI58679.1 hypothetical protein E2493_08565 [Sphingomonas parva]